MSGLPAKYSEELGINGDSLTAITALTATAMDLPAATAFPVDAMPRPCRALIREAAAAIGCPPEFVGLPMLEVIGSAIGNARTIRLKAGWEEGAGIYAAVIAEPGEKKTPALKVAQAPATKLQARLRSEFREAQDQHKRDMRAYEVEKRDAQKAGEPAGPPPLEPTMGRTVVEDTTVEALAVILEGSPRGVAAMKDELSGWVRSMDQYKQGGRGADRQFWLSAWSNSYVAVDRKSRQEPLILQRPYVGVFGAIQPGILHELGADREDGLLDRFLFAFPDPTPSAWTDDEISEGASDGYARLYDGLRGLHMPTDEYGDPDPTRLYFAPGAKELIKEAINELRREMYAPGFPARLKGPWSKLEAYIARLCLILAMSRVVDTGAAERVEESDVLAAVYLADYFKKMARRVYARIHGDNPEQRLTEDVVRFLMDRGGTFDGRPAELHDVLRSEVKPPTAEALTRKLKPLAEKTGAFAFTSGERWVRELGNKRRFVTLSLKDGGNSGNSGKGAR